MARAERVSGASRPAGILSGALSTTAAKSSGFAQLTEKIEPQPESASTPNDANRRRADTPEEEKIIRLLCREQPRRRQRRLEHRPM